MRLLSILVAGVALAACQSTPDGPVAEAGSLERGDATLTSGEFTDRYTVRLQEGQWLRVTLDSDAFDPYLVVRFPDGQQSDRDDSAEGDTTTVTMAVRAQAAGTYEIIATSFRVGATGAYRLVYEVSDTELTVPEATAAAPADADASAARAAADDAPLDPAPDGDDGSRSRIRSLEGDEPSEGEAPAAEDEAVRGDKTLDA